MKDCDAENLITPLWVLEGKLDIPIFFPVTKGSEKKSIKSFFLDASGCTGDGYLELKVEDPSKIVEPVWWSYNNPIIFKFRASVRAESMIVALERANDFIEKMADRLTFILGKSVRVVEVGDMYNETELSQCMKGELNEFEYTAHGVMCEKTDAFEKLNLFGKINPSERAQRALRWYRKGMTSLNIEDKFLGFLFCLGNNI